MDQFDLNLVLINVKLKPYKFQEDEVQNVQCPTHVYWEGQGDVSIDDEEVDNDEKAILVVHTQAIVVQQETIVESFFVKVQLEDLLFH